MKVVRTKQNEELLELEGLSTLTNCPVSSNGYCLIAEKTIITKSEL